MESDPQCSAGFITNRAQATTWKPMVNKTSGKDVDEAHKTCQSTCTIIIHYFYIMIIK